MSPTTMTLSKPAELDNSAAWTAYSRSGVADLTDTLTLRDGRMISVRAIRPDDVERLQQFHARLSPDTIVMRYFRAAPVLHTPDATRLTHLNYDNRMALVATIGAGSDERIVGVVRYERVTATEAELAFVIEDGWQGQGISTNLLARLLRYAKSKGFETMSAVTMSSNMRMRAVLSHTGYPMKSRYADGCQYFELQLTPSESTESVRA